jgi:hypothetical protein
MSGYDDSQVVQYDRPPKTPVNDNPCTFSVLNPVTFGSFSPTFVVGNILSILPGSEGTFSVSGFAAGVTPDSGLTKDSVVTFNDPCSELGFGIMTWTGTNDQGSMTVLTQFFMQDEGNCGGP